MKSNQILLLLHLCTFPNNGTTTHLVALDKILVFQSPGSIGSTPDTSFNMLLLPILFPLPIFSYLKYGLIDLHTLF